jgi:hypothetical protein
MSFDELSDVSKNLVSLTCLQGFEFNTARVDMSSLIFPRLEIVEIESQNISDLQFIATVLKNSIPQGQGFLKSLFLRLSRRYRSFNSFFDHDQYIYSLIKIIEVWFSLSNE